MATAHKRKKKPNPQITPLSSSVSLDYSQTKHREYCFSQAHLHSLSLSLSR
ncbi:hypothetical protein Hanom_Chr07g00618901 [Helianthus anomalus]